MELPPTSLGMGTDVSIAKYNRNHGADGRFSSGAGGSAGVASGATMTTVTDGKQYSRTAHAAAERVHRSAVAAEPIITQHMTTLAATNGMELQGLAFRLKSPTSLARKIDDDARRAKITEDIAASTISDAVRYTAIVSPENYSKAVTSSLEGLRASGYKTRVKNYWTKGDDYQGLNVALTAPDGHPVELQFHTATSFQVKEAVHLHYEKYRTGATNEIRKREWDTMVSMSDTVPVPPGVESIPELKVHAFEPVVS